MSLCIAAPGFSHDSLPDTMISCPLCGKNLRFPLPASTEELASSSKATISLSTPSQTTPATRHIIIDSNTEHSPTRTGSALKYHQAQGSEIDRFTSFQANRNNITKTRAEGFISKKEQLVPKGKFEVGSRKEMKVSDNRTADIWVGYDGAGASTFKLRGSVSLHFEDLKQDITDLPKFINEGILNESYTFLEYMKTKDLRKFGANQQFTPYLATGVSNGTFTRVALSTLWQSFTIGSLLKHFPAKKPMFVVIAYEGHIHSSEEENIPLAGKEQEIPKHSGIKEIMRKRSRSMAKKEQIRNKSSSPDALHTPSPVGKHLQSKKSIVPALETVTTELEGLMSPERMPYVKKGKEKEVDIKKERKLPKGYVYEPVSIEGDKQKEEENVEDNTQKWLTGFKGYEEEPTEVDE
ncbi:hypothetical protein BDD12DRAFT_888493 [Trichophaea hybrida]|nr:hypothetical protein BDD12DRAFT_888493 [Trichophaea hybrida]